MLNLDPLGNFFNDFGTALGVIGLVGIYYLTKRTERRNAATIVVMDIKNAEELGKEILKTRSIDFSVKVILPQNNWGKSKHLFVSKLSGDDFAAINRFFDACVQFDAAASRMKAVFESSLIAKARILQEKIFEIDPTLANANAMRQAVLDDINKVTTTFGPDKPIKDMFAELEAMGNLSNTPAFEKLKRIGSIYNFFRRSD